MSQLQSHLVAAAIGATVGFISAASILLYQKFAEGQQQTMKTIHLDEVNQRLTELQRELETLKIEQNQQKKKKKLSRRHVPNDSTYTATDDTDVDVSSRAGTDIGDDEFFDCSDSENGTGPDSENGDIERTAEGSCAGLDYSIFDVHSKQEGYEKDDYFELRSLANTYPNNVDIIWRYARSSYKYSNCITDLKVKKSIILEGLDACEKLLALPNADLHKWYAILIGIYGEFLAVADKIRNGYRFEEHVTKALEMFPENSGLYHLLGRFRYEMANLSWLERKVLSTLFSSTSISYEDAVESFQEAEKFATEVNLENRLFLSKCYIAINNYEQAFYWLDKICDLSVTDKDDEKIQNDARELLTKYSGYRT